MINTIDKLKDIRAQMENILGREPSLEEISKKISHPIEHVRSILRMTERLDQQRPTGYESLVSAFLLDTPSPSHGGTGRVFDWNLAIEFKKQTRKPVILSGGLNPENVAEAIRAVQPYAVDVSSGVESAPGRKDHAKLRDFIRQCKSC